MLNIPINKHENIPIIKSTLCFMNDTKYEIFMSASRLSIMLNIKPKLSVGIIKYVIADANRLIINTRLTLMIFPEKILPLKFRSIIMMGKRTFINPVMAFTKEYAIVTVLKKVLMMAATSTK